MAEGLGIFKKVWEWISHLHVAVWLFEITHGSAVFAVIVAGAAAYWAFVTQMGLFADCPDISWSLRCAYMGY
jgi:hypothetical protein